jgi:peroxiredoxin
MSQPTRPADQPKPPESPVKNAVLAVVAIVALSCAVWYIYKQATAVDEYSFDISNTPRETNNKTITVDELLELPFTDEKGAPLSLKDRVGKKHLVIVVTRGSMASVPMLKRGPELPNFPKVCAYCSSQASGIAGRMADFEKQDAEVLLVFPIKQQAEVADAEMIHKSAGELSPTAPFTVLIDPNCAAVEKLQLQEHLAKPASFIIDKAGHLRFAYVATAGAADRPSGNELLRHVSQVNLDFPAAKPPDSGSPESAAPKGTSPESATPPP